MIQWDRSFLHTHVDLRWHPQQLHKCQVWQCICTLKNSIHWLLRQKNLRDLLVSHQAKIGSSTFNERATSKNIAKRNWQHLTSTSVFHICTFKQYSIYIYTYIYITCRVCVLLPECIWFYFMCGKTERWNWKHFCSTWQPIRGMFPMETKEHKNIGGNTSFPIWDHWCFGSKHYYFSSEGKFLNYDFNYVNSLKSLEGNGCDSRFGDNQNVVKYSPVGFKLSTVIHILKSILYCEYICILSQM